MTQSIPALLRAHGLSPRKGLGQNFLVNPAALQRIVEAADLSPDDTVVEVGAGLGTLTLPLAERAGQVIAVELDAGLLEILRGQLATLPNVRIVHGDILRIPDLGLRRQDYKVVANLPYYITSAILRHYLENEPRPSMMVVTIQQEVAKRIVAGPGRMSLLAISVQLYGQPRIVARIPAGAFYPAPKVDSAILRIDVSQQPTVALGSVDEGALFRVAKAGFGQKRKMLRNSLSAGLGLVPAAVEEAMAQTDVLAQRRAQTLSLEEWVEVTIALSAFW